jgi:hypothetical protein
VSGEVTLTAEQHAEIERGVRGLKRLLADLRDVFRETGEEPAFRGASAAVAEAERILELLGRAREAPRA